MAQLLQHPLLVDTVTQSHETIAFCFACQDNYRVSHGASCVGTSSERHLLCAECMGSQIAASEGRWLDAKGMFCTYTGYTGCNGRICFHELPTLAEGQHATLLRARDLIIERVYIIPKEAEIARLKEELVRQDEDARLELAHLQCQLAEAREDKRALEAAIEAKRQLNLE